MLGVARQWFKNSGQHGATRKNISKPNCLLVAQLGHKIFTAKSFKPSDTLFRIVAGYASFTTGLMVPQRLQLGQRHCISGVSKPQRRHL